MKIIFALLLISHGAQAVTSKPSLKQESHFAICESSMEDLFIKLEASDLEEEQRKVSYSDTLSRSYYPEGLIIRRRDDETTVKIHVADLSKIDEKWFDLENFRCESDLRGAKKAVSCSLSSSDGTAEGLDEDQLEFIADYGPRDFDVKALTRFGPAEDTVWRKFDSDIGRLDFERYRFPDGSAIYEVSSREASSARLGKFLSTHQVQLCADQTSKTESFFHHF